MNKLTIGTEYADFNGTVNIMKSVNDFRDLDIGTNEKTYPISLDLTATNRRLLKFVNYVNSIEQVTDSARLFIRGMDTIKGKLRILKVYKNSADVSIDANIWSDLIDGLSIRDLDWSGDTHTFNATNVKDSWTASQGALYRYPLINFAQLHSDEHGQDAKVIANDFVPMWNVYEIITRIFTAAGYHSWSLFNNNYLKDYYILSEPRPVDNQFISQKGLKVYPTSSDDNLDSDSNVQIGESSTLSLAKVVDFNSKQTDEGIDWSITEDHYTVPETGTYHFSVALKIWCDHNQDPGWNISGNQTLNIQIRKNGSPLTQVSWSNPTLFSTSDEFYVNGGWQHFEQGDEVEVYINAYSMALNYTSEVQNPTLEISGGVGNSWFRLTWDNRCLWPGIGYTYDPSFSLPDIDCVDFLKWIKQMFNLRFFFDHTWKYVTFEPAEVGWIKNINKNWSDKVDYGEEVEQEIIASNYKRHQKFFYKEDSNDASYEKYVNQYGVPFQKIHDLTSEYAMPGTDEYENGFSPTIMGSMGQIGSHYADIPRIWDSGNKVESWEFPNYRPESWAPRIFKWFGMTALTDGRWGWYTDMNDTTPDTYTTFPKVACPDWSDLFDSYWKKTLKIIDNNRIITAVLKLRPHEIRPFQTQVGGWSTEGFRIKYRIKINGVEMIFLITKIITDGERCKVEMIQYL